MKEQVVLVDQHDRQIGIAEKLAAHQEGTLHRAFSVFIFNRQGEMLLQRRATDKYHSSGLWSNACCSHPRPYEDTEAAAHRRLKEELGFDCELTKIFDFIYRAELDQELIEHELDHVFIGTYNGLVTPAPKEVCEVKWITPEDLQQDVWHNHHLYTEWFKIILEKVLQTLT
ncbi:MAG TPA: isopentenyl-diphosphate Delta-isomerase [bacterium]|nr:isopentenyl-diphosphate Delta-isomerase [bacterium]